MLYRLAATGRGSRVALSEMFQEFRNSSASAVSNFSFDFLTPGPERPGIPVPRSRRRCAAHTAVLGAGGLLRLRPFVGWKSMSTPSFAPPEGVRGAGAVRRLLVPYWTRSPPCFAPQVVCTELGGSCSHPVGRGLRLPSRRRMACAQLSRDGGCYHSFDEVCVFLRAAGGRVRSWSWTVAAAGRGLRLPSRRRMACVEREPFCCCSYPTERGLREVNGLTSAPS